jgi:hypothetical protein
LSPRQRFAGGYTVHVWRRVCPGGAVVDSATEEKEVMTRYLGSLSIFQRCSLVSTHF